MITKHCFSLFREEEMLKVSEDNVMRKYLSLR